MEKLMRNSQIFFLRLFKTLKSPKILIPLAFIIGIFLGISVIVYNSKDDTAVIAVLVGAILSVVIERLFDFGKNFTSEYRKSHPLRKIFESIGDEDSSLILSPFFRDTSKPDESKLYRYDRDRISLPLIAGTQYLYGKGDALAMSFLLSAIEKIALKDHQTTIEDDWQVLEKWGKGIVCIGAHNAKVREILSKFSDTYYQFALNYHAIIESGSENTSKIINGDEHIPAVFQDKGNDSSVIDYGFILKLQDQFHLEKKTIIVIAGIGDWGTAGAAYYLLNHYFEIPYHKKTFGILIEVPSGYQSARKVDFKKVHNYIVE